MSAAQVPMRVRKLAIQFQRFVTGPLAIMSVWSSRALAQNSHSHNTQSQQEQTEEQKNNQSALIKIVRDATDRFRDVKVAENAGYRLEFGCVSGDDFGAMGLHYVNDTLVGSGIVDATRPQIVLYESLPNGDLQLTGADYLVLAEAWDAKHPGTTPQLMGQIFHYFEAPNRFGLPAFYTLHVWGGSRIPRAHS